MSFYFSTGTMHVWYGNIEPIDFGATDSQPPLHWLVPLTHNLCYTDAYIPANLVAPDPYIYQYIIILKFVKTQLSNIKRLFGWLKKVQYFVFIFSFLRGLTTKKLIWF